MTNPLITPKWVTRESLVLHLESVDKMHRVLHGSAYFNKPPRDIVAAMSDEEVDEAVEKLMQAAFSV